MTGVSFPSSLGFHARLDIGWSVGDGDMTEKPATPGLGDAERTAIVLQLLAGDDITIRFQVRMAVRCHTRSLA